MAPNNEMTSVSLNGVKKGEATSVAIMVDESGIYCLIGSDIYIYSSLLKENRAANMTRTEKIDLSARSRNSII